MIKLHRSPKLLKIALVISVLFLLVGIFFLVRLFHSLPSINLLTSKMQVPSIQIVDRNGLLLYEITPGEGKNIPLTSDAIPQCLKDATIAVEDKNFYKNPGIDLFAIFRAAWLNLQSDEIVSGASTITQQVARNLLLNEDERYKQTYIRKIREAVLALQLAQKYSKDEILAIYLNQMYYGGLSYGVEAVSQTYFGKPANELILPECALLAGLPQAPSYYNPYENVDKVLERQKTVLELMFKEGYISAIEKKDAENYSFHFNPSPYPIYAPHFVWLVKNQIDELYDQGVLQPMQSMVVRTTLDLDIQKISESAVNHQIDKYHLVEEQIDKNVNNAALVVIEPNSGEVLSMIGSLDYFDDSIDGAVNMATSPRQTGSALKPFIYALALDPAQSEPWTAATPLLDISQTFMLQDGRSYTPSNYDLLEHGFVSLREALGSSLNIPAVMTLEKVGIEDSVDFLKLVGISSIVDPKNYDLSLALGGGQISLLELSSAYGVFASGGFYYTPTVILDIRDTEGEVLYTSPKSIGQKKMDARIAWLISDILSDDNAREIGFGIFSTLRIDRPAAVKTGTTTNFHDNWTIGYTPDYVVGVWVGNSNFEAMHDVSGLTGAAPIWHETIRSLMQGKPTQDFEQPAGLEEVEVCAISGLLPTDACLKTRKEWFLEETIPTEYDSIYQEVWVDSVTGLLADNNTPDFRKKAVIAFDLTGDAAKWAESQGWLLVSDLAEGKTTTATHEMIELTSPQPKTTYRIDPNFEIGSQQLMVEAETNDIFQEVRFWVDGQLIDTVMDAPYQTWWQLTEGEHEFWAEGVGNDGITYSTARVKIRVIRDVE